MHSKRHSFEFEHNSWPICPHCEADYKPDDPDHGLYQEDECIDIRCPSCSKTYACQPSISFTYSTAVDQDAASNDEWGPQKADAANT